MFLVGTGMHPEEALALEPDIDKTNGVASIERVHSQGRTKPCMKSDRQRRRVPLRAKVLEALDAHPRRIGTRLVFPAHHEDDYLKLSTFSHIHWTPALRAAGIAHRGVYAVGIPSPRGRSRPASSSST
jgi:integrase